MKNNKNVPKDFVFKKKFGQNFLKDEELLNNIVLDAEIREDDNVLEIGAGAGALTEVICSHCTLGKVISVEIDNTLIPFLQVKLQAHPNLELINGDILKVEPRDLIEKFGGKPFKVIANLPYYISSPILFYLLESGLPIESITVMLQKELVDRITAQAGDSDYSALSVILSLYGEARKTRDVPRTMFTPQPNVDSSVFTMQIQKTDCDIAKVSKVIKGSFAMRRKTLVNNLIHSFAKTREQAENLLKMLNLPADIRAERLTKQDYIKLADLI